MIMIISKMALNLGKAITVGTDGYQRANNSDGHDNN